MSFRKEKRLTYHLVDAPKKLFTADPRDAIPVENTHFGYADSEEFPTNAFEAEVFYVDSKNYRFSCTAPKGRIIENASWLSPYAHPSGNGSYAMPQPGCRVLLLEIAQNNFVSLGYLPVQSDLDNNYRNSRKNINQGDLCFSVKDSCYMQFHRTADHIEVVASAACWMRFDGTADHISASAHRYTFYADGGSIDWASNKDTKDTWLEARFRDYAKKGATHVVVRAGHHAVEDDEAKTAEIDKSVFSIIVNEVEYDPGADTTTEKDPTFKFIVGRNGRILLSAESVKEFYRDYIERHVETTITNIAKEKIYRVSSTEIHDKAPIIRHNP